PSSRPSASGAKPRGGAVGALASPRGRWLHLGKANGAYGPAIHRLVLNRNYLLLLSSMFLMAGSFSLLTYYSPALLQDIGVPRPWIGPIQAIGVVFEIVLFQWQPALIRRWNYATVIVGGCIALCLRHLLFGLVENAWVLAASYL